MTNRSASSVGKATSTTIKVSTTTRDALRRLANLDGLTLDEQIMLMVRRDRRRRIGEQLATGTLDETDRLVLDASDVDVDRAAE